MTFRTGPLAAVAALFLGACGSMQMTETPGPARSGTGAVENACVTAVNTNMYGSTAAVVSSEPLGSGTLVVLRSGDGTNWRCTVSGGGVVEELTII